MTIPKSLDSLEQLRTSITNQIAALGDLRCGSITSTTGRCGKPNCHCHQPKDPGHGPNLRVTFKVNGKTVTQSLPNQSATRKVEREIAEFRKLQSLHKELIEVNAQICQLRPSAASAMFRECEGRTRRGRAYDGPRSLCAGLSDRPARRRPIESRLERVFPEIPARALDARCSPAPGDTGRDDCSRSARPFPQEDRCAARLPCRFAVLRGCHRRRSLVPLRILRPG